MNHDYAHCMDYRDDCPMECFRARLTRDLNNRTNLPWKPYSWMHFEGTEECKRKDGWNEQAKIQEGQSDS